MFDLLLSLELKSHILQTNSHFTPELPICALGDLTMHNLAHTSRLLDCSVQLLGTARKFLLIVYFSSWVRGLLVLGCCPSPYATLWILHVPHAFQGSAKQTLFPFVGCSQGFRLKDLWSKPIVPFTQGSLNEGLLWNLRRIESNCQHLRKSNHITWSTSVPKMFGYKNFFFPAYRQSFA